MMRARLLVLPLALVLGCEKKTPPSNPEGSAPTSGPTTAQPSAAPKGDSLLFGEVGSLTGTEATFGTSTDHGIELAVKEINAAGGLKGKQVVKRVLDDEGKPDEAATDTSRLISQDHATVVLGEVASTNSKQMAPICQQNHVPMISPSSTNPDVTLVGDYIFRVCFIDPFQGTVMAKFAHDNLKATKVALLKDVRSDYSMGLGKFFSDTFTKLGGQVVKEESYSKGDVDFKAQLTSIKALAPDAIYVPGYYSDVGLIAQQARDLGITIPLLGGDGWDSAKLYEIGGKALDGCYFSNHYAAEDPNPHVQKFIADYKAAYGEVPDGLAALGYDAAKVAADGITRAKTLSGADIRDAIAATKDFEGVTGKITLDANRNPVKSAVVLKIQDGRAVYQTTVAP